MKLLGLFLTILIILLILVLISAYIIKYYSIPPKWPYLFDLTNIADEDQRVTVWVNGKNYKPYNLPPGKKGQIVIGDNIQNPKTEKPYKREEILIIAFQFEKDGKVNFTPVNVNKPLYFSAETCKDENCGENINPGTQSNIIIGKKGFYTMFL